MLVFEYASNGTLFEHLHCKPASLFSDDYVMLSYCILHVLCAAGLLI